MASRCQQVTCGFNTCALELAYAVKDNNFCERWESCQKKKSKCSLLGSAPNLHMALGFQNSKIIDTGEPSLKNTSEHWLKWALWHWATLRPTNSSLEQQQPESFCPQSKTKPSEVWSDHSLECGWQNWPLWSPLFFWLPGALGSLPLFCPHLFLLNNQERYLPLPLGSFA